jgi:hypothetical protein
MNRLDGTSRSPIFVHFSETINGLSSIKAFGRENDFKKKVMHPETS